MSNYTPGDKVIVHIGGKDADPTGHEGKYLEGASWNVKVDLPGWIFVGKSDWVEKVTPPCPWTELGTIVRIKHGDIYELADRGWFIVGDGRVVDYDSTIAPYNPVRLIPEGSERAAQDDMTPVTGFHILHLVQTDSGMFKASCHCGSWSPIMLVSRQEARDAHGFHLANVGEVSS